VVIREEAGLRLKEMMAMRGGCIAATLGPLEVWDVLYAVVGPLLFGTALWGQRATHPAAVTVGDKSGGAGGVGLSC